MKNYTVIIPSKNPNNLAACLTSAESLNPGVLPHVVVYDNCGDGSIEKVCIQLGFRRRQVIDAGRTPFVYAQAINTCYLHSTGDLILLNDDATLTTSMGFDMLHLATVTNPEYGVVSAGIKGMCGNKEQKDQQTVGIRSITRPAAVFICVCIPRQVFKEVGMLDERLIHYGYDDSLFCLQARNKGYGIGVYDGCVVKHGHLPSTYRQKDNMPSLAPNKRIFEQIIQEQNLLHLWTEPLEFGKV